MLYTCTARPRSSLYSLFLHPSFIPILLLICIYIFISQGIRGIPPIPSGYNPATWMLEISTPAAEQRIGQDFAEIFQNSQQFRCATQTNNVVMFNMVVVFNVYFCGMKSRDVEDSIERMSIPPPESEPLKFDTTFPQSALFQFRSCLWKQNLVYWRSPSYNVVRLFFTTLSGLILGTIFWGVGNKR